MNYIITKDMEELNHCLGSAFEIIFRYLGISPKRVLPYHDFMKVDKNQDITSMEGILHSLITEVSPEEFIDKYLAEKIFIEHEYKLNNQELYEDLKNEIPIFFMIDTYMCPWCSLYKQVHFEHIAVIEKKENTQYNIIDLIFSKKRISIDDEMLKKTGKSFFKIIDYDNELSYKEAFANEIRIMEKYENNIVQSQLFEEILLNREKYILDNFSMNNPSAMLITNFFKQLSIQFTLYSRFVKECMEEDDNVQSLYALVQESIVCSRTIFYNFMRLGLCGDETKKIYFEKVINSIRSFNRNELDKKKCFDKLASTT